MSFGQNTQNNPYAKMAHDYSPVAAHASVDDRVSFIRRTYLHLAVAIGAFVLIETIIITLFGEKLLPAIAPMVSGWGWLVVLGAFMGASWLASHWAHSETSVAMQYAGLGMYVLAWSAIFIPILAVASRMSGVITLAAVLTLVVFGGLTAIVFVTKADFSFMRSFLCVASLVALGVIVAGIVFQLPFFGAFFCGLMILLASGHVLYDTSNVLHHYRTDQHVGASLALFSGIAMLFWYIIQMVMIFGND